jgi:hypothetical protein
VNRSPFHKGWGRTVRFGPGRRGDSLTLPAITTSSPDAQSGAVLLGPSLSFYEPEPAWPLWHKVVLLAAVTVGHCCA